MKKEINCLGCTSHYLYYSKKEEEYVLTNKSLEAFDNEPWIDLSDEPEKISNLINLLQYYKQIIDRNKANLSEQQKFDYYHPGIEGLAKLAKEINETALRNHKVNLSAKRKEQIPIKERSYLGKLLDIASATSNKD